MGREVERQRKSECRVMECGSAYSKVLQARGKECRLGQKCIVIMQDSPFRKYLDACLATASAKSPKEAPLTFMETHQGGAKTPEARFQEDRHRAVMEFFYASLLECAEKVMDREMAPINGTPVEARYELRPDSVYYAYHLARKNAYANFSDEQRQALKGLLLMTAFDTFFAISVRLCEMSEHEMEIRLKPNLAPDLEHRVHDTDCDGLDYWRNELPQILSKYEY